MGQNQKSRISSVHPVLWCGFFLYLALLIKLIIFKHPMEQMLLMTVGWSPEAVLDHMHTGNYTPFHTIRLYLRHWNWLGHISFANLIYNVIAFVPYGIIVPILRRGRKSFGFTLITGILLSALIEMTQLFGLLGEFDVDDIILNSIGVFVGLMIYKLFRIGKGNL